VAALRAQEDAAAKSLDDANRVLAQAQDTLRRMVQQQERDNT